MTRSYSTVTELPGSDATPEQLAMLATRYHLAGDFGEGRDVLEVACGPGIGLGYLAGRARSVVGGDFDGELLRQMRSHRGNGARVLQLDAHALPFAERSFDLVVLFEALYYLARPESFVDEARRVLRPGGTLLICTANKEAPGFNPSPHSYQYLSGPQLHSLLSSRGFATKLYGGFLVPATRVRDRVLLAVRRAAVRLGFIPKTMRGKQLLKRILYRRLVRLPDQLGDEATDVRPLTSLSADQAGTAFRVLYAVGRLP